MSSQATSSKPDADEPNVIRYASRGSSHFDVLLAVFCMVLVVSNIAATKATQFGSGDLHLGSVQIWPVISDGGAILFPLAYILGDVISEVYGFAAARRAIFTGFVTAIIAFATLWCVIQLPQADFYTHQEAFSSVVWSGIRIVFASLCGYLSGQFINAYVMVRMKSRWAERRLVGRLFGSTGAGEFTDTLIFCAIASGAIGITSFGVFVNYFVVGFVFKCAVEYVVMPVTVVVIAWLKAHEPTYHQ